jgi:hypothetical protein
MGKHTLGHSLEPKLVEALVEHPPIENLQLYQWNAYCKSCRKFTTLHGEEVKARYYSLETGHG